MKALAVLAALAPALAHADDDPCASSLVDPVVTAVRDADLDAQRSACPDRDVSARVASRALIDTPGFRGVLGGELILGGRLVIAARYELAVQLHLVDYTFVQNAVNKVTHTAFGPIVIGALRTLPLGVATRGAIAARIELPYTGDPMETLRVGGALDSLVTHRLASRWFVHGRLGAHAMYASSLAGSTERIAIRAGADLVWEQCTCMTLQAGADVSAGWYRALDHVLVRGGMHWRLTRDDWRLRAGLGVPVGGHERTNAVVDLAVVHGL